jgi:hypothetical protein
MRMTTADLSDSRQHCHSRPIITCPEVYQIFGWGGLSWLNIPVCAFTPGILVWYLQRIHIWVWIVALLMDTHYSTAQRINLPSHLSDRSHHVSMLLVEQSISDMESGSILKNSAKFWTYLQVCVKIE